jgi:hypothetical protein
MERTLRQELEVREQLKPDDPNSKNRPWTKSKVVAGIISSMIAISFENRLSSLP